MHLISTGSRWLVLSFMLAFVGPLAAAEPTPPKTPATPAPAKKDPPRPWSASPALSSGERRVSVFGIPGEGSRYIYVFDRSASMGDGKGAVRPLTAAKAELVRSLTAISSVQQFQVIFYNERPKMLDGRTPRFFFGDDRGRHDAEKFIDGITAEGGSGHYDALISALNLGPDVIFFLTDGGEPQLTAEEFSRLHSRAERVGAKIHTIEFGAGLASKDRSFVKQLAEENGGKYVYVDTTNLPQP